MFMGVLLVPATVRAETLFGFEDGKFYDINQNLKYFCFLDNNCYDLNGKFGFKRIPVKTAPISDFSSQIFDLVNKDRVANGLKPLVLDTSLVSAAQAKANDEATQGYFSHTSPQGVKGWDFIATSYVRAGENLGLNFYNASDLETAWMNSPTHKANILDSSFTHTGIAVDEGMYQGQKANFIVQLFTLPQ